MKLEGAKAIKMNHSATEWEDLTYNGKPSDVEWILVNDQRTFRLLTAKGVKTKGLHIAVDLTPQGARALRDALSMWIDDAVHKYNTIEPEWEDLM